MAGPVLAWHQIGIAAPGANTDILATALTVPVGASKARVHVNLATGSVFKARVSDGTNTYDEDCNGGVALAVNGGYTFDVPVAARSSDSPGRGMTLNFQVETDGVIQRLTVLWIYNEQA